MSCESCTNKELADQLVTIQTQAKEYAITNQVNTIIYKQADGQWAFITEDGARAEGVQPILFVSKLRPATSG